MKDRAKGPEGRGPVLMYTLVPGDLILCQNSINTKLCFSGFLPPSYCKHDFCLVSWSCLSFMVSNDGSTQSTALNLLHDGPFSANWETLLFGGFLQITDEVIFVNTAHNCKLLCHLKYTINSTKVNVPSPLVIFWIKNWLLLLPAT